MSQTRGGNLAFAVTNQCLSTLWWKSGKTLVYYAKLIVRNGLIVTWALCYSPDICMVYYRTIATHPNVQLKEGFSATKTILLCSQRKSIRLAESPDSKFWFRTSRQTHILPWTQTGLQGPHSTWAVLPGHRMAGTPQGLSAKGSTTTDNWYWKRIWGNSGVGSPEDL